MQVKVLIVDDELIVRKGLRALVPWEQYGMEIVAEAANGERGWEEFVTHKPQIVITDIVMPQLDGLSLAKRIKQQAPDTRILLLSCHQDFAYAQQGIQIGVSGYLLKTVLHDDELKSFLHQFRQELAAESRPRTTQEKTDTQKRNAACYAWLMGLNDSFCSELDEALVQEWSWMRQPLYACLLLHSSNEQKQAPLQWGFLQEEGTERHIMFASRERCFFLVGERQQREVEALLIAQRMQQRSIAWRWSGPVVDVYALPDAVQKLHRQAEMIGAYAFPASAGSDPIGQAIEWVLQNLARPLSVQDAADQVGLSRSHFSTLFKRKVGESFGTFVEKRRRKLASEYLATTTMNVQEIADRIGMTDAKYFSKWFKKSFGCSPREYRRAQTGQKDESNQTKRHVAGNSTERNESPYKLTKFSKQ